jgi:hypothetical protein
VKVEEMNEIAVVVTCHAPYLRWLPEALASIDGQAPVPDETVLMLDGCRSAESVSDRWRVIEGDWGHPSGGRNAGLAASSAPWLVFWDADNVMPDGYLAALRHEIDAAPPDLGVIYPDIQYCDEQLQPQSLWIVPEWDYWDQRAENCIDTAGAWRREAVELAGGWSERTGGVFEDYALALDVTALGWKAKRLGGPPVLMRLHAGGRLQRRWQDGGALTDLWRARSLAIVTLLAGRDATFGVWEHFLRHAELPPRTALYVVDNSGRDDFSRRALDACRAIADERGLSHVDFAVSGQPYRASAEEPYFVRERHLHVARLYASVLPRVTEDLVMTLEDDIEPPLDAPRRLGEVIAFVSRGKVGAVGAAYSMPQNEDVVCLGWAGEGWGSALNWHELPTEPMDVNSIGGGCTVWANWALRGQPINFWWDRDLGWDGALCMQLRQRGFDVRVHGGVRCRHHLHGKVRGA